MVVKTTGDPTVDVLERIAGSLSELVALARKQTEGLDGVRQALSAISKGLRDIETAVRRS